MRVRLIALVVAGFLFVAGTAHAGPVRLKVALGGDAALGGSTSVSLRLKVDDSREPVTEFRLLTPAGVNLATSELGMATCVRPKAVLTQVLTTVYRAPCPHNALMGTGWATARLRFEEMSYGGAAQLSLYAGASVDDRPGLIVIANAFRPVRAQLTYRGYVYVPPPEFGVGLAIKVDQPPQPLFGAPLSLSSFRMVVGAASLRYARTDGGRRVHYRPRAVPLPAKCPVEGLRFRAIVRFGDEAERLTDDAVVPCPSRRANQ